MSRALWTVEVPFNRQTVMMQGRMESTVAIPPQSDLLDLRCFEAVNPQLWLTGDMDEPCVDVAFLWLRTGQKIDSRYSFVGLIILQGSSFSLFVAAGPQTSNKVRTP